jgi:hypothetical protein
MTMIRFVACQGVGDLSTRRAALCHSRLQVEGRKSDLRKLPLQKAQVCEARRRYCGEQEALYNGKEVVVGTATQNGGASV